MNAPRFGRSLKPFRHPWRWALAWMLAVAAVCVASLLPGGDLPPVPDGFDKVEHFLGYAVLAADAMQLFTRRLSWFSVCVGLALMGLWLEHAQGAWIPSRTSDPMDALANTLGVLAGLATSLTPQRDALVNLDRRKG